MLNKKLLTVLAVVICGLLLTAGYNRPFRWWPVNDMSEQIFIKPFTENSLRDPAEGSVAVDAPDPVPGRLEADAAGIVNPIPLTDESVVKGKELYDLYCLVCHGVEVGLDPTQKSAFQTKAEASGLVPFPITVIRVRSDAYIFATITNGGAIMKRLDYHMDPEERWHVVNYVRSIANKSLQNQ